MESDLLALQLIGSTAAAAAIDTRSNRFTDTDKSTTSRNGMPTRTRTNQLQAVNGNRKFSRSNILVPPLALSPLAWGPRRCGRTPPSPSPRVRSGCGSPARVPLPVGSGCESPLPTENTATKNTRNTATRPRRGCIPAAAGCGRTPPRAFSREPGRPSFGESGAAEPGLARDLRTRWLVRERDGIAVALCCILVVSQQGGGHRGHGTQGTRDAGDAGTVVSNMYACMVGNLDTLIYRCSFLVFQQTNVSN